MAPGYVLTTIKSGSYGYGTGTSFSAPLVAGLASLLIGVNPDLTPAQVTQYIIDGCAPMGGSAGWKSETGWGLVNFEKSLKLLLADMGENTTELEEIETIFNGKYNIETTSGTSYIKNMEKETTTGAVKTNLGLPSKYNIEIKNIDGQILTDIKYIGTGSTLTVKNQSNELIKQYKVVVKGDITGEGEINIFDITKLTTNVFNPPTGFVWNEAVKKAAKVTDSDGDPRLFDIQRLISYCFDNAVW
jgi:hypothetical protein